MSMGEASRRNTIRFCVWSMCIAFVVIYLIGLAWRPVIVPDEARYAIIPAEMISTGQWIVPHLLGIEYFEKPVLGYWMTAVSFLAFGENAFSLRLPSAILTGVMALMLLLMVRRWTNRWDIAALASLVLLTTLEPAIVGTAALLDAPFSGLVVASIVCFYLGWKAVGKERFWWLVASGVACGGAFLIKGFLAFAFPVLVLAPWLMWQGRWRDLFVLPWIPLLAMTVTAAPWSIAVHMQSPEYWDYFFWQEHVHRYTGGGEAQHPEPWWMFGFSLLVGLIPWVFAAPLAFMGLLRRGFGSPESRLLVCWLVIPLVFLSFSSGKLPTYILPCFPAAAALIAVGLVERFRHQPANGTFGERIPGGILIALGVLSILIMPFVPTDFADGGPWLDGGTWRMLLVGGALLWWGLADWWSLGIALPEGRVAVGGLAAMFAFVAIPAALPTGWMMTSKVPLPFLSQWTDLASHSRMLVDCDLMHAAKMAWPEAQVDIYGRAGELNWGMKTFADRNSGRQVYREQLPEAVAVATLEHPVVMVVKVPSVRLRWINSLVEQGSVPQPSILIEDDLLIATWPAAAGPSH